MATSQQISTVRTSAALPAAGAFDISPIAIPIDQGAEVTFFIDYTRGGAGGGFQYKIEFSLDNITWYQEASVQEIVIVAGSDLVANSQRALVSYIATSASQESFVTETLTVAANWIRFNAKETGNVGAPGTLQVKLFKRINC